MKITYLEGTYGLDITMTPETPQEMAELLRYTKNAKAIKPEVRLYFNNNTPSCSIWLKKIKPQAQKNSITNP